MSIKVRLSKGQLDYFRRKARSTSNEILAYLIGDVASTTLTVIDSFEYTKIYATSTPEEVSWFTADYEKVKKKAEERGRRVVGFIHSHPYPDASVVMSSDDYKICIKEMFRLCGVCATDAKGRTEVKFWVMDSAVPCKREYDKNKRT